MSQIPLKPKYGYYFFTPYVLMLVCFIILGTIFYSIGIYLKTNIIVFVGIGTILYGILTTIGWLLSRYVLPGSRIEVARDAINDLNMKGNESVLDIGVVAACMQ